MIEAMLFVVLAVLISLLLTGLLLPAFDSITSKKIELPLEDRNFWITLSSLAMITGLISGAYPSLFLSSFQPIKVLKGTLKFRGSSSLLRKGLVVFQFALSIILIIGTITISRQVKYIETKNIGFDRKNLIYVPLEGDLTAKYDVMRQDALKIPGVIGITRITSVPTQIGGNTWGVDWTAKDPDSRPLFTTAEVGYEFVKTMKLQLVAGRDFSKELAVDSANYIVNESALQEIGYKNAIGKPLSLWGVKGQIIGVLKDFHFNSFHEPIAPLILKLGEKDNWGNVLIRAEQSKTKDVLARLEAIWKDLNPRFTFSYQFADDDYQSLYKGEQ
jgi:hypothetical protein